MWLFFSGVFVGVCVGVFIMALMNAASCADDVLYGDDQYNEK